MINKLIIALLILSFISGLLIGLGLTPNSAQALNTLPVILNSPPTIRNTQYYITQLSNTEVLISGLKEGVQIQTVAPTQSMIPTITYGVKLIMQPATDVNDLQVGDIIEFIKPEDTNGYILHRIYYIGQDSYGWYCKVKADVSSSPDDWVLRPENVKFVLLAVIY